VVWSLEYKAFGNNVMSLAFREKSEMAGSISQLNLNSFKFPKLRIYTRSILGTISLDWAKLIRLYLKTETNQVSETLCVFR
jgi:hypothetical protein